MSRTREPEPPSRRSQLILGIVVGVIVGVVIAWLTQFWLWIPAGVAMGLATGTIMGEKKPPEDHQRKGKG